LQQSGPFLLFSLQYGQLILESIAAPLKLFPDTEHCRHPGKANSQCPDREIEDGLGCVNSFTETGREWDYSVMGARNRQLPVWDHCLASCRFWRRTFAP
jgi:hypothetical protein